MHTQSTSPVVKGARKTRHVLWKVGIVPGLLGLLLAHVAQAQSANLLQNSTELNRWTPVQGASAVADVTAAPNGSNTADQIVDTPSQNQPRMASNSVTTNGGAYVFSCYLRAGTLKQATLALRASGSLLKVSTFSISTAWQRVSIATPSAPAAGKALVAEIYPGAKGGETGTVLAWGAQLETGTTPTPNLPSPPSGGTTDTTPPAVPSGLTGSWNGAAVALAWNANTEADQKGYVLERAVGTSTTFAQIATPAQQSYSDAAVVAGTTYSYRLRSVDTTSNVSAPSAVVSVAVPVASGGSPDTVVGNSRGYLTTPQELATIRQKAASGLQPYKSAVSSLLSDVRDPSYWPYGVVDPLNRVKLQAAAALVYAKGLAYHLTGDARYAESARDKILQLSGTDTGPREYSGSNGNVLTLGRHIPAYVFGADLIEDYPGWSKGDKQIFQTWLATRVYHLVDWASDERSTNWGGVGSACTAVISDYMAGSGISLIDRNGNPSTAKQAFTEANKRAHDRMNGNSYMYNSVCSTSQGIGIRADGGIPEELGRGSTGCDGKWLLEMDSSWSYMQAHISGIVLHAELLLRRGDRSLFDNINADGSGSLRRAIRFVIANPNKPTFSWPWLNSRLSILEIAYRYYRDPDMAKELGIGTSDRNIDSDGNTANPHFGTLTHGFATNENPALPPTVPPPAQ